MNCRRLRATAVSYYRFFLSHSALAGVIAGFGFIAGALAQVPLPPSTDPGRIQERVVPPAPARELELPEFKGPAPAALPDPLDAIKITLTDIQIEAATTLPLEQALADYTSRYIGREITGNDVFDLARALTAMYRNAGYILSQVFVPPQSLSEGTLRLRVIEGYIANVRIEGDPSVGQALAELGEKIKASRPLHASVLERYLLIANELPGVQLRSVLAPSQTLGAADLTLIATVKKDEGFVALDNYGSRYLGPGQLSAAIAANQLFGANDQVRFTGVSTGHAELAYGQLAYSQVLNAEGLKLGAAVSQAQTKPGDVLEPFEVRGSADTATVSAGYPFLRTRNRSLLGRAVYDHRNVDTDILGTRVIKDKIRALRLGLTSLALDRLDGHNTLDVEYSAGLGGTRQDDLLKSRADADGKFSKIAFDYERFQRIGGSYGLTVGAGGQWAKEPLLSSEQFALGGRRFGRAYEPAELVGDRALALRVEPAYLGPGGGDWLKSYQLYGFYDLGKVWNLEGATPGTNYSRSLAAAGFGMRLVLDRNLTATLEAAWPLTKPVAGYQAGGNGKDARILGSMVVRF